jgi:hypothetical protein
MNVSFDSAGLSALCGSERRMADRWGPAMGRTVGRRLLDLQAATASTIGLIPTAAVVTDSRGETTITFGEVLVVRGIITVAGGAATDSDHLLISSVDIEEGASP